MVFGPKVGRLSKQQKTGFVLLLVFGVLAVGLGLLQMRNTIYSPFVVRPGGGEGASVAAFFDETTRLQQIDTDQDGLNDYEEMNFYGTSAYLPDTDSDGIEDKTEIEEGTDPLCPESEQCPLQTETPPSPTTTPITGLGASVQTPMDILGSAFAGASLGAGAATGTPNVFSVAQDPALLRELLIQTGSITEAQLAGISDEALLELARDVLSGQPTNNE
ncbi:MAG: hypothetical protein A3C90_03345 [Candidatus Magasanikbacteria bacterium RIFCSPHIGHO2_02_FULL_51_14]|uniref:Uncharacterized protein n=1 Tax=Candidatus Magasanikbacteria bacterium RIFCSPHIGHO2_02_FULL_51_14 TaxID=1798683 RepID=A0A1F6MQE9_9BACT|nr:MAG: hypothetical protein A3C90_03345 [Candidatus Magasanikbacteria bacterium RIFCSPHIGHO2_02_FULL_51_14]